MGGYRLYGSIEIAACIRGFPCSQDHIGARTRSCIGHISIGDYWHRITIIYRSGDSARGCRKSGSITANRDISWNSYGWRNDILNIDGLWSIPDVAARIHRSPGTDDLGTTGTASRCCDI